MSEKLANDSQAQPNSQADAWRTMNSESDKGANTMTSTGFESNLTNATSNQLTDEKKTPEAREMGALYSRYEEMRNNPNRLDNFEGEHVRGARTRDSEYTTLNTGANGMYASAPDGTPLNNAARKKMAQMMHDAEELQILEENEQYKDYIEHERAKIGTVYQNRADFNHKIVTRLNHLAKKHEEENAKIGNDSINKANDKASTESDASANSEAEARARQEAEARARREEELRLSEEYNVTLRQKLNALTAEEADLKAKVEQSDKQAEQIVDAEVVKELETNLRNAKEEVAKWRDELAELYAKNRGLFVSGKNRTAFAEVQGHYRESLSQLLRLQAQYTQKIKRNENAKSLQSPYDEIKSKLEAGEISAEGASEAYNGLSDEWSKMEKSLKTTISTEFLENYLTEQKALEDQTIDRIDNGNLYRKVVSKLINNKPLKAVLATAGLVGLAATGFGLATGALALGVSYTAGGVALGAGKGALSGLVMSRQSSKNSAVRGFAGTREEIEKHIKDIDAAENDTDVKNVTNWLLKQYNAANQSDHSSNIKRTAIAMGLGAAIGGATSGIQINQVKTEYQDHSELVGYKETDYKATNLETLSHKKGTGTQQLFRELGGDSDAYYSSGAHEQMAAVIKKYGMTVGENDWTYPGPISEWPETARQAFSEVADEWARKGLVAATKIGGEPVYNVKTEAITTVISDRLHNFFVNAGSVVGAGILGGAISGRRNRIDNPEQIPSVRQASGNIAPLPFEAFEIAQPSVAPQAPELNPQPPNQNTSTAPVADMATMIQDRFLAPVGEEGVNYMTYEGGAGPDFNERVYDWWQTLTPEARQDVIEYEKTVSASSMGRALREWLKMQELI